MQALYLVDWKAAIELGTPLTGVLWHYSLRGPVADLTEILHGLSFELVTTANGDVIIRSVNVPHPYSLTPEQQQVVDHVKRTMVKNNNSQLDRLVLSTVPMFRRHYRMETDLEVTDMASEARLYKQVPTKKSMNWFGRAGKSAKRIWNEWRTRLTGNWRGFLNMNPKTRMKLIEIIRFIMAEYRHDFEITSSLIQKIIFIADSITMKKCGNTISGVKEWKRKVGIYSLDVHEVLDDETLFQKSERISYLGFPTTIFSLKGAPGDPSMLSDHERNILLDVIKQVETKYSYDVLDWAAKEVEYWLEHGAVHGVTIEQDGTLMFPSSGKVLQSD